MTSLSAREREDDSYRSYYEAWAAILEMSIRSGEMPPAPNNPEQARWASEGPRRPSQLDCVRGWVALEKVSRVRLPWKVE